MLTLDDISSAAKRLAQDCPGPSNIPDYCESRGIDLDAFTMTVASAIATLAPEMGIDPEGVLVDDPEDVPYELRVLTDGMLQLLIMGFECGIGMVQSTDLPDPDNLTDDHDGPVA